MLYAAKAAPAVKPVGEVGKDNQTADAANHCNAQAAAEPDGNLKKGNHPALGSDASRMRGRRRQAAALDAAAAPQAPADGYARHSAADGDRRRVEGYRAVICSSAGSDKHSPADDAQAVEFSERSRAELPAIARAAVKAAVEGSEQPSKAVDDPELQVKAGCFVTLKNRGRLRGCIGRFVSDDPLWKTVRAMAKASAKEDTRFASNPIRPDEVPHLDVEISVLSPLRRVKDPLKELRLGKDGIIIRDKGRSGTFLPQVATETGWSLEEFLGHCAREKAGLGWDGWRSPTAEIWAYTVTIIEEEKK